MAAEVEALHVTVPDNRRVGVMEFHRLSHGSVLEDSGGTVRVRIPDEEDRVLRVVDEAEREVVAGGVLRHHAAADRIDAAGRVAEVPLAFLCADDAGHGVEDFESLMAAARRVAVLVNDLRHTRTESADVT